MLKKDVNTFLKRPVDNIMKNKKHTSKIKINLDNR